MPPRRTTPAVRHQVPMTPVLPVAAQPAATVVLARQTGDGLEVLLTERPATMAFGPGLHVFPGGAVDPGDASDALAGCSTIDGLEAARRVGGGVEPSAALAIHVAAIRELFEEVGVLLADTVDGAPPAADALRAARSAMLDGSVTIGDVGRSLDLRLRTDLLVPLSRWVTPVSLPRRFDTWFFVAALPVGIEADPARDEIVAARWLAPAAALRAMADGSIRLVQPTAVTLQQLARVRSIGDVGRVGAIPSPDGPPAPGVVDVAAGLMRIDVASAGGVPGRTATTWLVGHDEIVIVDPGDPSQAAFDAIVAAVAARRGRLAGVAISGPDPELHGGVEAFATGLGLPVVGPPGCSSVVAYRLREVSPDESIGAGDLELVLVSSAPGRFDYSLVAAGQRRTISGRSRAARPADSG